MAVLQAVSMAQRGVAGGRERGIPRERRAMGKSLRDRRPRDAQYCAVLARLLARSRPPTPLTVAQGIRRLQRRAHRPPGGRGRPRAAAVDDCVEAERGALPARALEAGRNGNVRRRHCLRPAAGSAVAGVDARRRPAAGSAVAATAARWRASMCYCRGCAPAEALCAWAGATTRPRPAVLRSRGASRGQRPHSRSVQRTEGAHTPDARAQRQLGIRMWFVTKHDVKKKKN